MPDPVVGILVGSESDRERMQAAMDELDALGIAHEFEVRSAHRTPDAVAEYAKSARGRGLRVLICGAGLAAVLPGVVAAHTALPVIGVPLRSSMSVLDGVDALLSIVQMPPGVPVATVGVDNAKNAAVLAARILALLGVVAAHTDLPVIGVPLRSSKSVLDGLDALLSIVQMPPGVPVACVGVDNAKNAAVLAARILAS